MDMAVFGLAIAAVLAVMYFTRKKEEVEAAPTIPPVWEGIEDWRRELWEGMVNKPNTEWTEEEWASLEFHWGDPGYREAFIRHYGITAWNELIAKMEAYKKRKAEADAFVEEMETFVETQEKVGYTYEEAIDKFIEEQAEEQLEEIGITKAELPSYQDFALKINEELGGSYVAGMLTPPSWWTGSVTQWSQHVQQVTAEKW